MLDTTREEGEKMLWFGSADLLKCQKKCHIAQKRGQHKNVLFMFQSWSQAEDTHTYRIPLHSPTLTKCLTDADYPLKSDLSEFAPKQRPHSRRNTGYSDLAFFFPDSLPKRPSVTLYSYFFCTFLHCKKIWPWEILIQPDCPVFPYHQVVFHFKPKVRTNRKQ